ncbi:MAG: lipopolysaccharide transport periplasmic protein LptA [Legionellaceae bacterium]|nr:lipopolysaccharide transport periplasmic protein LptA [Legionellaceae bacterium]
MVKLKTQLFLILFSMIAFHPSYALSRDKEEAIQFKAGHVTLNHKMGTGSYTGGVSIDQGSSHLRAQRATTQVDEKNHLTLASAFGSMHQKAHFWTLTSTDKPPLHAYANIIHYHPLRHQLELIGDARIVQGKNELNAPHIRYDIKAERFITTVQNNEGTIILIDPNQHPEKSL